MIYSLKGILTHVETSMVVIECGGVGFQCMITATTQQQLPAVGENVKIYTHLNVREDAMDLYGFASPDEMNCFKMLTGVSGVGPKVGLAILSELAPEQVAMAIAAGDSKTLTRASGVGTKLAQRIVLELTDKVKKMALEGQQGTGGFTPAAAGIVSASAHISEAVNALSVLGYSPSEAAGVVARFDSSLPVEELIRLSLKEMARRI